METIYFLSYYNERKADRSSYREENKKDNMCTKTKAIFFYDSSL